MSTILNARSPYYIKVEPLPFENPIATSYIELTMYSGVFDTDKPVTPTYILEPRPVTNQNYIILEISELVRDYLEANHYEDAIDGVWVYVLTYLFDSNGVAIETNKDSYDLLALDGFGYFNEGVNPRTSTDPTEDSYTPMLLQSNQTIYFVEGRDIRIPLFVEAEPEITSSAGLNVNWEDVNDNWEDVNDIWGSINSFLPIADSDNSLDKINYYEIDSTGLNTGDIITIQSTNGNNQTVVLYLIKYCEQKYEPYRILFYNKFGAIQDIWTTKRSNVQTSTKDESYKTSLMDFSGSPTYSTLRHNNKRFNVESNQSITLNTDFIIEDLNEPIEQMLMSENIWIENETETIPVILKSKSLNRKTIVNDKLIQYTFEFDYAFDTIQNIR